MPRPLGLLKKPRIRPVPSMTSVPALRKGTKPTAISKRSVATMRSSVRVPDAGAAASRATSPNVTVQRRARNTTEAAG